MKNAETTSVRWMITYHCNLEVSVAFRFMKIFSKWIEEIATMEDWVCAVAPERLSVIVRTDIVPPKYPP